jgi:hypothetical protein
MDDYSAVTPGAIDEESLAKSKLATLIRGLGQTLLQGVMFPGEYMKNGVMDTDSAASWAIPQALGMVGGPGASPVKVADSTLGSFASVGAKTADMGALQKANKSLAMGKNPEDVRQATGWVHGLDGLPRFEINDRGMKLNPSNMREVGPGEYGPRTNGLYLPDVMKHDDLFKAYPELGGLKIEREPIGSPYLGGFLGDRISLAPAPVKDLRSVLSHEVQHGIQDIEGLTAGGGPSMFTPKPLAAAEDFYNKVKLQTEAELAQSGLDPQMVALLKEELNHQKTTGTPGQYAHVIDALKSHPALPRIADMAESERLLAQAKEVAHTKYERLGGEVEARNVQTRLNYTPAERKAISPEATESVPRFLQTIVEALGR